MSNYKKYDGSLPTIELVDLILNCGARLFSINPNIVDKRLCWSRVSLWQPAVVFSDPEDTRHAKWNTYAVLEGIK